MGRAFSAMAPALCTIISPQDEIGPNYVGLPEGPQNLILPLGLGIPWKSGAPNG